MGIIKKNCCVCGKSMGLNRYGIGPSSEDWICPACMEKAGGKLALDFKHLSPQEMRSYIENDGAYLEAIPSPPSSFQESRSLLIDLRRLSLDLSNRYFKVSLLDPVGTSRPVPFSEFDRAEIRAKGETLSSKDNQFFTRAQDLLMPKELKGPAKTFDKSVTYPACRICLYVKGQEKPLLILRPVRREMNPGFPAGKRVAEDLNKLLDMIKTIEERDQR